MITQAKSFEIAKDIDGKFPDLKSSEVSVKWIPDKEDNDQRKQKGYDHAQPCMIIVYVIRFPEKSRKDASAGHSRSDG